MGDDRSYRFGPLFGFLLACAVMIVLIYALLIGGQNRALTNCAERNSQIAELNERVPITNLLIHLERQDDVASAAERKLLLEAHATIVPLSDCAEDFAKPWPVGSGGAP